MCKRKRNSSVLRLTGFRPCQASLLFDVIRGHPSICSEMMSSSIRLRVPVQRNRRPSLVLRRPSPLKTRQNRANRRTPYSDWTSLAAASLPRRVGQEVPYLLRDLRQECRDRILSNPFCHSTPLLPSHSPHLRNTNEHRPSATCRPPSLSPRT